MTKLLLAVLLFSPLAAHAEGFSGHWVATDGQLRGNVGISGPCRLIDVVLEQTANAIVTKSYKADCQRYSTDWGPVTEEIRGGKVYEGDDEVGTFDGAKLETSSQSGSVTYIYNLQLGTGADGKPTLESRYGVSNFAGQVFMDATLKKAE